MINRRELFHKAKNFAIYYGNGLENELAPFDIAVLEPAGHSPEQIRRLKETGTLVFAYMSVTEVDPSSPLFRMVGEKDFLHLDGRLMTNELYGNYIVDLRSKKWREILLHTAGSLLIQEGYDGLFLDTVGNVENSEVIAHHQNSQIKEAIQFMTSLKEKFPEFLLVQNNGLEKLWDYTSGVADGICWENPPFGQKESQVWTDEILLKLDALSKAKTTRVMLLLEYDKKGVESTAFRIALKLSGKKNYLLYFAPKDYVSSISPYKSEL